MNSYLLHTLCLVRALASNAPRCAADSAGDLTTLLQVGLDLKHGRPSIGDFDRAKEQSQDAKDEVSADVLAQQLLELADAQKEDDKLWAARFAAATHIPPTPEEERLAASRAEEEQLLAASAKADQEEDHHRLEAASAAIGIQRRLVAEAEAKEANARVRSDRHVSMADYRRAVEQVMPEQHLSRSPEAEDLWTAYQRFQAFKKKGKDKESAPPSLAARAASRIPLQLLMTGKFNSSEDLPPALLANVKRTLKATPGLRLRYLNDSECRRFLLDHEGDEFVKLFDQEKHGSFRGDMCRSAVLLREGGFYMDIDFQLDVPMHKLVDESTTFMSVVSYSQGSQATIMNALIGVVPNSPVMHKTINHMKTWYDAPNRGLLGIDATTSAVRDTLEADCPEEVLKPSNLECGAENLRLYEEEWLDCGGVPSVSCPITRMATQFFGLKYGIFFSGNEPQEQRLLGWPRVDSCEVWGCAANGGLAS